MLRDIVVNKNNLFTGLVLLFAVSVGLFISFAVQAETSAEKASYDTWAQVNESDGQNISAGIATGEGMAYGEIGEGTNVTRTLELSSPDLTLVKSTAKGNMSEKLYFEEKILFRNTTSIEYMYSGQKPGYYNGQILLDIKTADNYWGEKWLELYYFLPF